MSHYPSLTHAENLNWPEIAAIALHENHESLVALSEGTKLKLFPAYAHAGIAGALSETVLRQTAAARLLQAAAQLPEHTGMIVYDGWRPMQVQQALRASIRLRIRQQYPEADDDQIQTILDKFVANPDRNGMCPPHLTGGSVDVALFDTRTGEQLDMGSSFDETSPLSWTAALETETDTRFDTARLNRRMLVAVMCGAGFTNIPTEWWHFDYGNANWAYFSHAPHAFYGAAAWTPSDSISSRSTSCR